MAEDPIQLEAFKSAVIAYRRVICEEYWSNDRDSSWPNKSPSEKAREQIFELYPKDKGKNPEYHLAIYRIMAGGDFSRADDNNAASRLKSWLLDLAIELDEALSKR